MKTGTTTLQRYLFSKHSQIKYFGKPYDTDKMNNMIRDFRNHDAPGYDCLGLANYNQSVICQPTCKTILLSDEALLPHYFDLQTVLNRIKVVFSPCKIVFTIRNQFDIIVSYYFGVARLGMDTPFPGIWVGFDKWFQDNLDRSENSYLSHLDYHRVLCQCADIFGQENIKVFLFEEFVNDQARFVKKLSDYLEISFDESFALLENRHANKRASKRQDLFEKIFSGGVASRLYGIFPGLKNAMQKGKKGEVDVNRWRLEIQNLYGKGNTRLAETFNLPLTDYHYPMD